MARTRIGELLVNAGQLAPAQLTSALAHQRRWGGRLGQAIVRLGYLSEDRLLRAVGDQLGAPFVIIGRSAIPASVVALVPQRIIRARRALPIEKLSEHRRGPLVVAFADPSDLTAVDEIAFATGLAIRPVLVADWDIDQAIARCLGEEPAAASGAPRRPIDVPPDTSPLSGIKKPWFH